MKLNLREKIWCFLFRFKFIRKNFFYKLTRYKEKLKSLDRLKLDSNSFVIDIGGNNGVVSYYIFDKFKCKIDIYEPNPYCALILNKIFAKELKITIYESAVSNTDGFSNLYYHKFEKNFRNMSLSESSTLEKIKSNISNKKFKKVKTENIKSILDNHETINFLKIDIEGHEYKILPEIIKNLEKIDIIFCEMHGELHRKEFKEQYDYWKNKIEPIENKKFFTW